MDLVTQLTFRPDLPVILNNADYRRQEAELIRMNELLGLSGIEEQFVDTHLARWLGDRDESRVGAEAMLKQLERARRALRCLPLMSRMNLPLRGMSQ